MMMYLCINFSVILTAAGSHYSFTCHQLGKLWERWPAYYKEAIWSFISRFHIENYTTTGSVCVCVCVCVWGGGGGGGGGELAHTMTIRDRFHCIERWPAHTMTIRDRFHCIERWPAHTMTIRDRFHCIERWPAHTMTIRYRFHCIERWSAHAVTIRDRFHCDLLIIVTGSTIIQRWPEQVPLYSWCRYGAYEHAVFIRETSSCYSSCS